MPDLTNLPIFMRGTAQPATTLRRAFSDPVRGPGVRHFDDWKASLSGGMNVQFSGGGVGFVKGVGLSEHGFYKIVETSTYTVTMPGNSSGNARLDQVVLRVFDTDVDPAAGAYKGTIEVVQGDSAVAGATLDNRSNARDLTTFGAAGTRSMLLLYDVLTPGSSPSSIPAGNIRDRRAYSGGSYPGYRSAIHQQVFRPASGIYNGHFITSQAHASRQAAALMYLDQAIRGATKIRWRYTQGSPPVPVTRVYNIGIYDASGRLIKSTGSVNFVNATGGLVGTFNAVFSGGGAQDFDAGAYYVAVGWGGVSGTETIEFAGVSCDQPHVVTSPGLFFTSTTGGASLPNTLDGLLDAVGNPPASHAKVPIISLSVT